MVWDDAQTPEFRAESGHHHRASFTDPLFVPLNAHAAGERERAAAMQTLMPFDRLIPFCDWKLMLDTRPVLSASQKQIKERRCSSDVGELNKPLRSGKTQARPGRARVLNIPFQSAAAVCLTLIKHNHKAISVCVNTHTHARASPSTLPALAELTTPGSWRLW